MPYSLLKFLVNAFLVTSAVVFLAAQVVASSAAGGTGSDVVAVAWWTTAWPAAVCIAFLLMQGVIPGARRFVPLPGTTAQDAWMIILILAMSTPATVIGQPGPGGFFATREAVRFTTFGCAAVLLVRAFQLRMSLRSEPALRDAANG